MTDALTIATFAAAWAILWAGHNLADHVLGQTNKQACTKGAPSPADVAAGANPHAGWGACWQHVGLYHLVLAVMFGLARLALPLPLTWTGLAAGFAFSALTHAFIDRRWPVRWLLEHTGSAGFAKLASGGLNGMYLADQALHAPALLIAAAMIARL